MDKIKKKKKKDIVWAAVTRQTIEQTYAWKTFSQDIGKTKTYHNVLNAALYELGYDYENRSERNYEKIAGSMVVRSGVTSLNGIKTEVFNLPIRHKHKYSKYYSEINLVNFNPESNSEEINLSEYGTEHYQIVTKKSKNKNKKHTDPDSFLLESDNYDNEQ